MNITDEDVEKKVTLRDQTGRKLKIAIATTGRFHVLDLARELSTLGHDIVFYSILPRGRAVRFGLPAASHRALFPWLAPLVAAQRFGGPEVSRIVNPWILKAADRLIARRLEPCDAFIGMSGLCVESARIARERYGAKVFIERGSRHIGSQKEILDEIKRLSPDAQSVPDYAVTRELASYKLADIVVVPSRHTVTSFVERGFPHERLFQNPYGVDLTMFQPTHAPVSMIPTVIYVGAWSYQKGCDLLTAALFRLGGSVRLLHVGAVADAPLPEQTWFRHQDAVPQWKLPDWYSRAQIFVLASRQEGLSLVQAQALACGLPVVCTDRTGGEDLAELLGLEEGIFVVPHDDVDALADAIAQALDWGERHYSEGALRDLLGNRRERLSWKAYALRYEDRLFDRDRSCADSLRECPLWRV